MLGILLMFLLLEVKEHADSMTEHRDLKLLLVLEVIQKLLLRRLVV